MLITAQSPELLTLQVQCLAVVDAVCDRPPSYYMHTSFHPYPHLPPSRCNASTCSAPCAIGLPRSPPTRASSALAPPSGRSRAILLYSVIPILFYSYTPKLR